LGSTSLLVLWSLASCFLALLGRRASRCRFLGRGLLLGKIACLIEESWQSPHYLLVRSEQRAQLLPELLRRQLITEVLDADFVVGLVRLSAGQLSHVGVKLRNQIVLDLRLYRKRIRNIQSQEKWQPTYKYSLHEKVRQQVYENFAQRLVTLEQLEEVDQRRLIIGIPTK